MGKDLLYAAAQYYIIYALSQVTFNVVHHYMMTHCQLHGEIAV